MEAHLLRTLSNSGEAVTVEQRVPEDQGVVSWQQLMVRQAAASRDADQVTVPSPHSDTGKDGK